MQAERWQQIERLFHAALQRAPSERTAWLAGACAGNKELRREVELLLAEHARGGSLLETAAADLAADWAQVQQQTTLKQTLGHFRLHSLLGKGGMGEVYLAEDSKLGRKVALKLLPAAFTQDKERVRRFELEARAASALNHPNIITIYEIGEAEKIRFIATEYIEGQTLRALLKQGVSQFETVLEVGVQVASALATAHEAGILHRDIKPENIMVRPDSLVKVLDFGLAKLTEMQNADFGMRIEKTASFLPAAQDNVLPPQDNPQSEIRIPQSTAPGLILGTASYMSPEQARGQAVDARTDIFSLGVVLYEMVAGRAPFVGATASDVVAAILTSEPAPLGQHHPDTPRELERIVSKCLVKERERRYQSAQELLVDLKQLKRALEAGAPATVAESRAQRPKLHRSRRWLVIAALALLAVITVLGYLSLFRGAPTPPEIKSLAVLPLENLSGDAAQEYFADGMTDALIGELAKIGALRVISRTSAMYYKGMKKTLPQIADELKVDAVVEGTVKRFGERVQVRVQLIRAENDQHLWSETYDYDLRDVLALQSGIARTIAREVQIKITPDEQARLTNTRLVNRDAHDAYLLGRYHLNKNNEQDWQQAITHFERALQLDPDYAAAYAGLSDVWVQRGVFAVKPFKEIEPHARKAALQALKLNEQLPEAHISLANLKQYYDWDWAGSEAAFKRALELNPGSLNAHLGYGHLLMHLGRHDEAVRKGQIAAQLDPLSAETQTALGRFLYRAQRYEDALPHLLRAVAMEPRSLGANVRLGSVYVQLRQFDEALAVYKKGRELTGDDKTFQGEIAYVYALQGKGREARQMIGGLKGDPLMAAYVYAALGDKNAAFKILEQAIEEHNSLLVTIKEDPPLDSLHTDPRWKGLLRRMRFPPE